MKDETRINGERRRTASVRRRFAFKAAKRAALYRAPFRLLTKFRIKSIIVVTENTTL